MVSHLVSVDTGGQWSNKVKLAPARSPFASSWSSLVRLIGFNLAIGTLIDHKLLLSFRRFRLCSLLRMLVSLVSPDSYHAIYILDVLRYTFSFYKYT